MTVRPQMLERAQLLAQVLIVNSVAEVISASRFDAPVSYHKRITTEVDPLLASSDT